LVAKREDFDSNITTALEKDTSDSNQGTGKQESPGQSSIIAWASDRCSNVTPNC
jgi:hypothetical protein